MCLASHGRIDKRMVSNGNGRNKRRRKNTDRQDCQRSYGREGKRRDRKNVKEKTNLGKEGCNSGGSGGYLISGDFLGGPFFLSHTPINSPFFGPKNLGFKPRFTARSDTGKAIDH